MKFVLWFCVFGCTSAMAQWSTVAIPTTGDFFCVRFVSPSDGLITGSTGTLRTTDGGRSWQSVGLPPDHFLWILVYAGMDTVYGLAPNPWLLGEQGLLPMASFDGGKTWKLRTPTANPEVLGLDPAMLRWRKGLTLVVGGWGTILATSDFLSFDELSFGSCSFLYDICVTDGGVGIAVGSKGCIVRTTCIDSLETRWWKMESVTDRDLFRVAFFGERIGVACGELGAILRTDDGGMTWEVAFSGVTDSLTGIGFTPSGNAYCSGFRGTILESTDKGKTWRAIQSPTQHDLWSMSIVGETVFVAGNGGVLLRRDPQGGTSGRESFPVHPPIRRPGIRR